VAVVSCGGTVVLGGAAVSVLGDTVSLFPATTGGKNGKLDNVVGAGIPLPSTVEAASEAAALCEDGGMVSVFVTTCPMFVVSVRTPALVEVGRAVANKLAISEASAAAAELVSTDDVEDVDVLVLVLVLVLDGVVVVVVVESILEISAER